MAVQEHDEGHGGTVGGALAVGQNLRHVVHLQAADDSRNHGVGQNGADQRQGDVPELLKAHAAVHFGGLEGVGADAHNGCHQHDGGIAEPHQEVHEADDGSGAEGGAQEVHRFLQNAKIHQNGVHGAVGGEDGEKQHGKGRGHDQVGQIDDNLKKLLALELHAGIGEPHCQQQRHTDLGNEADHPQNQGVFRVFQHIRLEQRGVILESNEIGADFLDAGAVVLVEAVANGVRQRDQREHQIAQEEGKDE